MTEQQIERGKAFCRAQAGKPYNGWTDEDRALIAHFGATQLGLIRCALVKSGSMPNPLGQR